MTDIYEEIETPRTKDAKFHEIPGDEPRVFADFAERLEVELILANRRISELEQHLTITTTTP